jgi:uncharacterized membrane protein
VVGAVLGATGLWLAYSSSALVLSAPGTNISAQFAGIIAHPGVFAGTVLNTIEVNGQDYIHGMIGILGWLTIFLPEIMYWLPMIAVLACLMLRHPATPRIGLAEALWQTLLLSISALLVLVALYLYWSPVGAAVIYGVQGRYFLPLAGLASVTLDAAALPRPRVLGPFLERVVVSVVAIEVALTSVVVVQTYKVS